MPSHLEELKKSVVKLERDHGPANAFVQGLKAQIASLEKPPAENPMTEVLSVGFRNQA